MKKIYLHVGPRKTGSSAIQKFCDANRNKLSDIGYYYPKGIWHGQLGSVFSKEPLNYIYNTSFGKKDINIINKSDSVYFNEFKNEIKKTHATKLICSYEGFLDLSLHDLHDLHDFLYSISNKVIIIMYYRDPLSFAKSEISQRAKSGIYIEGENPLIIEYKLHLEKFIGIFGLENIILCNFDRKKLFKNDVVYDFLSQIGIKNKYLDSFSFFDENVNKSLCLEATILSSDLSLLIGENIDFNFGNAFYHLYGKLLEDLNGENIFLSKSAKKYVLEKSQEDTEYVKRNFIFDLLPSKKIKNKKLKVSRVFLKSLAAKLHSIYFDNTIKISNTEGSLTILNTDVRKIENIKLSEEKKIAVTIYNDSNNDWVDNVFFPLSISYQWLTPNGVVVISGLRISLKKLESKNSINANILIKSPPLAGTYILNLSLVQDNNIWFNENFFKSHKIIVEITKH